MTCSRSCSHLMSELGPEHKSVGCPSSAFPHCPAEQRCLGGELSESNAVTTDLTLCRCQHCMDTALRKHRTLLPQTSPWTPPLPGQSWPGQSTLRSGCTSEQPGVCQMLSSQCRAGVDISAPTCGGPLVPTATSGAVGQALNPGWAGRS